MNVVNGKLHFEPTSRVEVATLKHAEELGETMDPAYKAACAAAGLLPLEAAMRMVYVATNAYALLIGGRTAAVFGVCAAPAAHATAFAETRTSKGELFCLLGTQMARAPETGLRRIKQAVAELLKHFDELGGVIDAGNQRALQFAQFLGAELDDSKPYGPLGLPHVRFTLRG